MASIDKFEDHCWKDIVDQDIIEILIANVKEFAGRLRTADKESEDKDGLVKDLGTQIDNLLNHLAEKEIRITALEKQWKELDDANEAKEKDIEDFEATDFIVEGYDPHPSIPMKMSV